MLLIVCVITYSQLSPVEAYVFFGVVCFVYQVYLLSRCCSLALLICCVFLCGYAYMQTIVREAGGHVLEVLRDYYLCCYLNVHMYI